MPSQEVIDLSLSTDDETLPQALIPKDHLSKSRVDSGFFFLSYYFHTNVGFKETLYHDSRKRRKLSPPPTNNVSSPIISTVTTISTKSAPLSKCGPKTDALHIPVKESDPIVLTSLTNQNAAVSFRRPFADTNGFLDLSESDGDLPEDVLSTLGRQKSLLGSRPLHPRANSYPRLEAPLSKVRLSKTQLEVNDRLAFKTRLPSITDDEFEENLDSCEDDGIARKQTRRPNVTQEEKAARARRRDDKKAAKSKEKEEKEEIRVRKAEEKELAKERKRLIREEQAREKQKERDILEANKLKLDKNLSSPEMIVDLPVSIDGSPVDTQIRESLRNIGAEVASYQSPVVNVIKWRRKVKARFNTEKGYREQLATKEIDKEKHVMCLMSAQEFVSLATADPGTDEEHLDAQVSRTKTAFNDCVLIYLIDGLEAWMRKNKNARNRAYEASVLSNANNQANSNTADDQNAAPRRKKSVTKVIDEAMIEDALLQLQVTHSCLVHHAAATAESAEWVVNFTQQISQIPYRYSERIQALKRTKLTILLERSRWLVKRPFAWSLVRSKQGKTRQTRFFACCKKTLELHYPLRAGLPMSIRVLLA